ncbi:MAG: RnfH family protein [Comamonas sp.]
MSHAVATTMVITLAYAPAPRQLALCELAVPAGATVASVLPLVARALGVDVAAGLHDETLALGIWGRKAELDDELKAGDRLECYRALRVDPKVARRQRFSRQGARATGLFSKRREGAKPGY